MTEIYKFFNSVSGDARTYQAADFADYFGSVLSTGLLHTDEVPGMVVSVEGGTLNTIVSAGKAIMGGHLYENTAPLTLTHEIPDATLNRMDRVVLRLDLRNSERNIKLHVKQGEVGVNPVAPALQRDNFIYEISLARIRVRANTVQLLAGDLYDERLDETVCGLAHSLISIPTSQFQAQWDAFMEDVQDDGFAPASEFAAHRAEDAIDAHNALNISVADANNRFTGTNVESVLNELFQFANSGKTDIASVIGSPATSGDSFSQLKTHIQNRKNELATNLSAKGQTSAGTETLDALVDKVALVNTGKQFASGSITATSGGVFTVTGLPFKPSIIIVYPQDGVKIVGFLDNSYYTSIMNISSMGTHAMVTATLSDTSFTFTNSNSKWNGKACTWKIYE